jgi:GNAT superfamily N-acetyltransferase
VEGNNIANYLVTELLRDGRQVTIRAIRPDDKGGMADALREVSPESLYRRTFSAKRELSADDLKRLTEVDFKNVVALVTVVKEEEQDRIVGGGRYIRTGESGEEMNAEIAFLIDDVHQGLGIGSRIFKHLVTIARASGITQFEAEVLPTNEGMLKLFARSGLPVISTPSRDSVHVTIDLNAGQPGADADRK